MAILKCEEPSADITSSIESRDGGMTLKEFSTWLLAPENSEFFLFGYSYLVLLRVKRTSIVSF